MHILECTYFYNINMMQDINTTCIFKNKISLQGICSTYDKVRYEYQLYVPFFFCAVFTNKFFFFTSQL